MKPPLLALLTFFLFPFFLPAPAAAPLPRPLDPIAAKLEPTRTIVYKTVGDRELRLHIFEPPGHQPSDKRPAWISIHGGGWTGGNARVKYPFAHHFSELGMVGISIDYRLLKNPEGTTVFDCVKDGRSAIRYLRQHATELGIDPDRIVVTGHSAGGHVAAGTALFDGIDEPADDLAISPRPDVLVLFYPVIDTSTEGYGNAKIGDRWKELSPVDHVRADLPPTLVLHGTGDTVTPFAGAKSFHEKMRAAGNDCALFPYEGGRHGYFLFDLKAFRDAMAQTETFLAARGMLPRPEETPSAAESLRPTLPPDLFAVTGMPTSIEFDNAVLTEHPERYRFEVLCKLGEANENGPVLRSSESEEGWTATPAPTDAGDHPLTLTVTGPDGKLLNWASTTLHVIPADAGAGQSLRLLIVGDSLTNASLYPNEIARLLSRPGNPAWTMLGTHKPANAAPGVAHEGYGGWSWARFVSRYEPEPRADGKKGTSPFVYAGPDGKPALDVARYIAEECGGDPPDVVTFLLGINDCFSADPDDPAAIDARIDAMLAQSEILITAFRKAAPEAELGVCLTTPPNARKEGFIASYKGRYHRWGWKRIQHRLVEREIEAFAGREAENVLIVPTNLNLDPVTGYPSNNGVHPNESGYKQIGASIYAWIKARLQAPK